MKKIKRELINNLNPRLYKRDENFLWYLIPQKKVWVHPPTGWKGNQVQWLAHIKQQRKNDIEYKNDIHKTNQYQSAEFRMSVDRMPTISQMRESIKKKKKPNIHPRQSMSMLRIETMMPKKGQKYQNLGRLSTLYEGSSLSSVKSFK